MKAKGLWAVLESSPFPDDVLKIGVKRLGEMIAKSSRRRDQAMEKAQQIYKLSEESIGLKVIGVGDRYRVNMYLEELKRSTHQLKEIEKQMERLLQQIPYARYLLSIKGVGVLSAAIFFGELGNPAYFKRYKQITKYAGYDPSEKDYGLRIGRRKISQKGRWLLRKTLYFMGMGVIQNTEYFKVYYQKKRESKNLYGQVLYKKEALCAVIIKLIKVIFALFREQRIFIADAPEFAKA